MEIIHMFYNNAIIRKKCEACGVGNLAQMLAYSENFIYSTHISYDKGVVLCKVTNGIILEHLKKSEDWQLCFNSPYVDIYFMPYTAGIKEHPIILKYVNKMRNHNAWMGEHIDKNLRVGDEYFDTHYAQYCGSAYINCSIHARSVRYNFVLWFDISLSETLGIYKVECRNAILNEETLDDVTEIIERSTQDKLLLTLDYLKAMGLLSEEEAGQIVSGEPLKRKVEKYFESDFADKEDFFFDKDDDYSFSKQKFTDCDYDFE